MTILKNLSLIVAMTPARVIGRDNDLPWYLPNDLRQFRKITTECGTMVMGRKTFDSITKRRDGKPLPNRRHIVLSRSMDHIREDGVIVTLTKDEARDEAMKHPCACVIGGTRIYELFMPYVYRMYITTVHADISGDAHFPAWNPSEWRLVSAIEAGKHDEKDEYPTSYAEYVRA